MDKQTKQLVKKVRGETKTEWVALVLRKETLRIS